MPWTCTKEMRWLETDDSTQVLSSNGDLVGMYPATKQVLQQKWVSNTGEVKWLDVPTVKEQ